MKQDNWKSAWSVICSLLVCCIFILLAVAACTSTKISNPAANAPSQNPAPSASTPSSTPPVVTPPATPSTPPPPPPPAPVQTPAPPSAIPPTPVVPYVDIIRKQANQMVLTSDDIGPGWSQGSARGATQGQTLSSSHVLYKTGTSFSPVVQNTVTVYRTMGAAQDAFAAARPTDVGLSFPSIGDECFLNDSNPIDKRLVFRKQNVVAWIWVQQDKAGDPVPYARTVEQKISQ